MKTYPLSIYLARFFSERLTMQLHASPNTVASYRDTFRLLLKYAADRVGRAPTALQIADIDADLVGDFLTFVETRRGNGARSRNTHLSAIRSFFAYVAVNEPQLLHHCQQVLAMPSKRYEKRTIDYLTHAEIEALVRVTKLGHYRFMRGVSWTRGVLYDAAVMRQIPFHRPAIGPEEEREVLEALRSGWITTGPKAKRFEQEFAAYVGARHALAVAHCTGALHLALHAIYIRPGDEIITTTFTFTATAEVMGYMGARPVFVDIDPKTLNIDPAQIETALASGQHRNVKAIMPVHFAGQACDMDRIMALARRYNLRVIEDAAHAVDSSRELEGRGMTKVGTIGDISCFSFYATKNITCGEGGMITTEDDALAAKIAVASLHGMDRDAWKRYDSSGSWFYEIHDVGFKYNLSDVLAAIGLAQLRRSGELTARRREIARRI